MKFDIQLLLLAMAPVFLAFVAGELWHLRRQRRLSLYDWRDSACSACLGLLHQGADKLAWVLVLPLYAWIYQQHRLFQFSDSWLSFLLLFIGQDFLYYWFHRVSHRVRWLWAAHSVHHSSTRMNFTTAFRQSLMYPLAGMWAFWLPLAWLGFPPEQVVGVVLLNLAFQFFVHTQACPKLGWLEYVLNTPSIHRGHHAKNPRYIDHNYAGVLVVWDRLFGTYVEESADDPCDYGTVKPVNSFNPLWVSVVEWRDMLREAWRAPNWKDRWTVLFGPPEAAEAAAARWR
ncbi:sterol desaturase/sphingolipid hydroxylase (fatty acid hydroxylase superfamily) [Chromobacterium alkanivorans]|uniref:sterol desaturase family protein n=1 Tax=Chromobacterium alkanivorans TaxID=1071719 RepID=UPI0021692F4F|nr:sterol desaturase family protein [Chromobacterium alkanivorans]MCS3805518.1 sterol desaturase/sphingolipid hydroxylase (fatty acid hydroxylase superfamily) [Chromobacterium alkanivorans]MCS3819857.1 sterol desaturase/sphingolipid hydroxylase (fatty acid hydroxylase superfamily) [Chromobacterium alkanivorans]MCS3874168.1 sterol desaturase/sphingolipid hydroxylase (fatty acid hydroxylase superfamily) [Chromobacterium alkanivorans]